MRFLADNSLSTISLFEERKKYKENVNLNYSIDTWYEKPWYGKIDREGFSVALSETNLKQLQTSETLFACDFVADAYADLQDYLAQKVLQRRIALKPPYQPLELEVAWVSVSDLYHEFMQILYAQFFAGFVVGFRRDAKIKTFENFIEEFLTFARVSACNTPICKSAFVKSSLCPNTISGLILEIKADKHDGDAAKQLLFENSSFGIFQNSISRFGFMLNKNNPFQMVFNVGSKQGQKYMKKYGIEEAPGSASDLFSIYYYSIEEQQDIGLLASYLSQFYASFIQSRPWVKDKCQTIIRSPVPEGLINNEYYWLNIYVKIRAYESGYDDVFLKRTSLADKVSLLYKTVDLTTAVRYIEEVLRK